MKSSQCDSVSAEAVAAGFSVGEWPNQEWWKAFGDPTLTSIIETALKISPNLQGAEARLKAAAQVAIEKKSKLFPEASFSANTNWQHFSKYGFFRSIDPTVPAVINDITTGLNFSYEFDFWGKNRALFEAALDRTAALAAERSQAELILTTSIAYSYAELQYLLFQKKILERIEKHKQSIEAIRFKRLEHALDTSLSQLQSQGNSLDTQASIEAVEQQILQNMHQLKALSGMGQDAEFEIEFRPLDSLPLEIPEKLSLDLLARRPDLAAQKARVESAAKEAGAAKTDFYPNVNLTAFLGLESIFWSKLLLNASYSSSLEPAIHLPIFTAGRIRAQWKEKVETFNAAVFDYNDMILKAAQEVADRLTDILVLGKQIEVRQASLKTAQEQAAVTQRRVENALDDQIALLDAENVALEKELTLAELEYNKQLIGILLIRALGGGYHE